MRFAETAVPARAPQKHGWYLVLAAAVLGVFVFCGVVVAAAGNSGKPDDTKDVSRSGALAVPGATSESAATTAAPTTAAAEIPPVTTASPSTAAAAAPGAATAPAPGATTQTKKPPTTKPPTKPATTKAQNCNPNYTPCVPNDPVDVDCAGGTGNGPSYVQGPVRIIGSDPYKLDSDNDGIGCE